VTDDVLIVSFDYNSFQPRFYSKQLALYDPNIYNVRMAQAVGGSSAVPAGFPPKYIFDGYNQSEYLIDGGVIGNNPSLIAWSLKKFGNSTTGTKKLRILSLGAGSGAESQIISASS
jgi:patatin-like phospholipase/acyl hydrolase